MNGLTAVLAPPTLYITTQIDDIQLQGLTLTITNTSGTDLVLSSADAIRIDFAIDLTGNSTGALLLANSFGQPFDTVEAAYAGGTTWQINPISIQQDLCSFQIVPPTGAGQAKIAAGQSIVFNFTNIAVDMVEGTSTVNVTLIDSSSGTSTPLTPSPVVTKIAPPAQINYFTGNGLPNEVILSPPANKVQLEWSTIAASCSLVWDPTDTTIVTYNGETITSPWIPATTSVPSPPLQTIPNAPVTAVVFRTTQFILVAEGASGPVQSQLAVDLSALSTALSGPEVFSPFEQFQLTWQVLEDMGVALTPSVSDNQTVDVSITADGKTPYPANPLPATSAGTVYVTVNVAAGATPAPVTFAMNLTAESPPLPAAVELPTQALRVVGVAPVTLSSFTIVSVDVIDPATGQQAVNLAWVAQNATSFTLTGYDTDMGASPGPIIGPSSYPYTQLTAQPYLPVTVGSIRFDLTAAGYLATQNPLSQEVYPYQVQLISNATASLAQVTSPGVQTVTLGWQFKYATSVMIFINYAGQTSFVERLPDASMTTRSETLPDITTGTVTYTIYAQGYPPPGDWDNTISIQTQPITPIPVSGASIQASQTADVFPGTTITLTWGATAAAGFILTADRTIIPAPPAFQASQTTYKVTVYATTTFTITAQGYTGGGQAPTASVGVTVRKIGKEEKDKDGAEKFGKDHEVPAPPRSSPGIGDAPATGLPSGSQQPFIGSDERPDVGAHLRDNDTST